MSHQSERGELEQSVAGLEAEAHRAYLASCNAGEYSERIDAELADARRELRHHIAAGDQS